MAAGQPIHDYCYLIPPTEELRGLLESADVGDMGLHTRCTECRQSDFVAYHIWHSEGCTVAKRLKDAISALPKESREELYRGSEYY